MKRYVLALAIAAVAIAPMTTHAQKGWKMRVDRSTQASDPDAPGDVKFMDMSGTLHVITPQAAVFWNPANTATGTYTLSGQFKLMKPSGHTNYYGLVFGGSNLEGPTQAYTYFLVAQDGTWLIKKRDGDTVTSNVAPKTPNGAVQKPQADGTSENALQVRVGADKVDFVINTTIVHSMPKSDLKTDGIVGFRSNHLLEVQVTHFGVTK